MKPRSVPSGAVITPMLAEQHGSMRTELIPSGDWVRALNDWTLWQQASHVPLTTQKLRSYHIRRLALDVACAPTEVTAAQLLDHLKRPGWNAGTKHSRRTTLRAFFSWMCLTDRMMIDPSVKLPSIRVPVGQPRPAEADAVEQGLASANARVRLMVELGVRVGLRCCEIAKVHHDDVVGAIGNRSLRVQGKGAKRRLMPMPDDLAEQLLEHDGWVFPGQIDGHLSPGYVSKLVSKALGSATAHQLRHLFATRTMRSSGGNLRVVQELMGHASLATTQIYTQVNDDELRRAVLAA